MKAISALIFWVIMVTVGSLIPVEDTGVEDFINADKFVHVTFYAVMTYLFLLTLKKSSISRYLLSIVICSSYGAFMEVLQGSLDMGRYFDYYDIIANIIGSLIGAFFYRLINK